MTKQNQKHKFNHFIDLSEIPAATLRGIMDSALKIKAKHKKGVKIESMAGKNLAMIFEKNSTRTRISFEVGMRQLGGSAMYLSRSDLQLGRGESIADTARVISRYVDIVMIRSLYHETVEEFAANSSVPVINGLTDKGHPCQIMADIMTFEEHKGSIKGKTIAWLGDCNNVAVSLMQATEKFGFKVKVGCPKKFWAKDAWKNVTFTEKVEEAATGADAIFTDTWVSMGDAEPEIKRRAFRKYQVNERVMKMAKKDAIFLHCLPAYRGEEVTDEVIDGKQSVVLDEAENRLHVQKGIMLWCLGLS